jgi:alpha-tubulin suppressor-like RCC1 family protein
VLLPTKIPDLDTKFISVSSGKCFTLLLDENGEVWGFGSQRLSKIFTWTQYQENVVRPTKYLELCQIVKIAAGSLHALALNTHGMVFSWGQNSDGQLGMYRLTIFMSIARSYV